MNDSDLVFLTKEITRYDPDHKKMNTIHRIGTPGTVVKHAYSHSGSTEHDEDFYQEFYEVEINGEIHEVEENEMVSQTIFDNNVLPNIYLHNGLGSIRNLFIDTLLKDHRKRGSGIGFKILVDTIQVHPTFAHLYLAALQAHYWAQYDENRKVWLPGARAEQMLREQQDRHDKFLAGWLKS
jgi:hypothetical protein